MLIKQVCLWVSLGMMSSAWAGNAETAFTAELHECAAYYQLGAQMVTAMNAPQMASVAERLQSNAQVAEQLASKYETAEAAKQAIAKASETLMQSTGGQGMGALMRQYKDKCQTILDEPQKRLDYWVMATM